MQFHTCSVLVASLCAASILAGVPPVETATVHNDKVAAVDVTLKPGETESLSGARPSVTVYFTGGALEIAPDGGKPAAVKVARGNAVFQAAQARTIKNTGSSEVHFARIEFTGKGRPETWGSAGLSPNYKILLENQFTRMYEIRIPAGTSEPQHRHNDRVIVCLSAAQIRHILPDGRVEPSVLKTGETAWRRAQTHIGKNVGKTDLWVIAMEPK